MPDPYYRDEQVTLLLGDTLDVLRTLPDGAVACTDTTCPRPYAVTAILLERETEHIVQFDLDGFTIRHPLRERLDDALMKCELHRYCVSRSGPPAEGPGRYRAIHLGPRDWVFQRTEEPS